MSFFGNLDPCPDCKAQISKQAVTCPHCGANVAQAKEDNKLGWQGIVFIIVLLLVARACGFCNGV